MDIRRAHPHDIPQLLSLIRRYWDFEGIAGFTALRIEVLLEELLAKPAERGLIWVAESERAAGANRAGLWAARMPSGRHRARPGNAPPPVGTSARRAAPPADQKE